MLNQAMRINLSAQNLPPVIQARLVKAREKVQSMLQNSAAKNNSTNKQNQKKPIIKGLLPENAGKKFDVLI